jgi:hypothetical protein
MRTEDLTDEPAVLIRIAREWRTGLSDGQLYERTRRYWKMQPLKRRVIPTIAFAVADGAVRAAYRIEAWETYDMAVEAKDADRSDQTPHAAGIRTGFVGRTAGEYDSIIGLRLENPPKAQNPISYLNC